MLARILTIVSKISHMNKMLLAIFCLIFPLTLSAQQLVPRLLFHRRDAKSQRIRREAP
jgi:hypothetical protein